jgi:hypothetical protein
MGRSVLQKDFVNYNPFLIDEKVDKCYNRREFWEGTVYGEFLYARNR